MAKFDLYQSITDRIVTAIETTGTLPWVKPWTASGSGPRNGATGRRYTGINSLLLSISGYASDEWYTFKNAAALGGSVRQNEKGTQVIFWNIVKGKDEAGKATTFPLLKYFVVFNREQIDGLPDPKPEAVKEFTPVRMAEDFIATLGANISHGGDTACYYPSLDKINLPEAFNFTSPAGYYATAFHELIHWTGHESRLNRLTAANFGTPEYAEEELVAELGAAFLCAEYGIEGKTQHPEYIANWLKALKNDKRYIFKASKAATAAVGFLTANAETE
jgi:antirestriction protein ArdC